jgi:membrane-associated phospholipid phosphatase
VSSFIKKNKLYLALVTFFVALCALQVIVYPKGSLVIAINKLYNPTSNTFFKYYTNFGDGVTFAIVCLLLFVFGKMRWGIIGLLSFAISGGVAQFLKKVVFGAVPRPHTYFKNIYPLSTVDGVDVAYLYSFPSGHTITVFAMFSLLAFIGHKRNGWVTFCFLAAVLGGISRIYLAQHFTEDVMAGTLIGFVCSAVLFYWLDEKRPGFFSNLALDKPLLKLKA